MLGASLYLVLASSGGSLSFQSGIALLVIFVIAMWDNIRSALRSMREEQTAAGRGGHPGHGPMRCAAIFSNFFWGRPASSSGLSS